MALGMIGGLLAVLGMGWAANRTPLTLVVDGQRHQVLTHAETVESVLRQAGLELYSEDIVSPGAQVPPQPGMAIHLQRSRPVLLSVVGADSNPGDGRFRQIRTQGRTVGALLKEAGIYLGPADEVWLGQEWPSKGSHSPERSEGAIRLVDLETPLNLNLPLPSQLLRDGSTAGSRWLPRRSQNQQVDPPMITVRRAASLLLDDGGQTTSLFTTATTVGQALHERGVVLFLGDQATPGLQEPISSGMTVQIQRSIPVTIAAEGHLIRTRTRAETVAGVLGQEGIALLGQDRTEPMLDAAVVSGMAIRVIRVREELEVSFEPIPYETIWVADPEVEIDSIRVVQDGQLGLTKRRTRIVQEDGREIGRFLEDVWTAQEPVTKTMAYGTKIVVRTLETPDGPIEYWRKMRVYTISYTAASSGKSKSDPRYGYTRLGWKATKGVAAVDPTVIPLRTRMYVPGYGLARAGDTGGGIRGRMVDLCFDVGQYESWHWWTDVYLLTPVPHHSQIRWVLPSWPKFPDRQRR